jgi:outer membrane autotransporter protein
LLLNCIPASVEANYIQLNDLSQSPTNSDGSTVSYQGFEENTETGAIKIIAITDNSTAGEITINCIANKPGLTETQQVVGSTMDTLCPVLIEKQSTGTLSPAEQDLLTICESLESNIDVANTLSRLAPDEVAAQGSASIEAAATQVTNVNTRLIALRGGDIGINLSGLTVNYAGISINRRIFEGLIPREKPTRGGAAGDSDGLQGRWGAFINGNINFGEQDGTQRETGFDFDTRGITMGLDYRFSDQLVAGGSLGFSKHDSDYDNSSGDLEMDAWSLSAYGTYYTENIIYVDGLIQIGTNSYNTRRRINATGEANQFGQADTDGTEYALNLSAGYEYRRDALILSPYGRLSYTRAQIDNYTEESSSPGIAGFGSILHIDDQELKSMVLVVGGNFSYTLSTTTAVLIPQLRFEWEHEFEDDARFINARFVNDPIQSGFSVETDEADRDYCNLGIGLSAVFAQGRSGYLFYETRLDQDNVTLNRIDAGLRIEF